MTFKRFLFVLFVLINIVIFSVTASAALPNLSEWNECTMYSVLNDGSDSNSAVDCIILRVDPELESNQLHMLFMADLRTFEDESKAGIKIKFNDLGTVELHCDSEEEYDTDIFFAEIDNIYSDAAARVLGIELTVGIKPGIPDSLVISFNLYDTQGIASNTYSVDISDSYAEEIAEEEISEEDEKDITVKTQKVRTTKYKTTKVKTTKSKKSTTEETDEEIYEYEENETELQQDVFEDVKVENDKNKLIIICAAAVTACTVGGCTVGIINSRKKKNSKGDDQ